jgi:Domain of unknown function (DUF6894)
MPRFFFDIDGAWSFKDTEGDELGSLESAKAYAQQVTCDLIRNASDGAFRDMEVIVRDESGAERFRIKAAAG